MIAFLIAKLHKFKIKIIEKTENLTLEIFFCWFDVLFVFFLIHLKWGEFWFIVLRNLFWAKYAGIFEYIYFKAKIVVVSDPYRHIFISKIVQFFQIPTFGLINGRYESVWHKSIIFYSEQSLIHTQWRLTTFAYVNKNNK